MSIFRYQFIGVTLADVQSRIPLGVTAAIIANGPTVVLDINLDDNTAQPDLDAYMTSIGWVFVQQDPGPPPGSDATLVATGATLLYGVTYNLDTTTGAQVHGLQDVTTAMDAVFVKNMGPNVATLNALAGQLINSAVAFPLAAGASVQLRPDAPNLKWLSF